MKSIDVKSVGAIPPGAAPADVATYRAFMGLGPEYETTMQKASFARVVERGYWAIWCGLAIAVSLWLAPYWGWRLLLVAFGFYLGLAGALVEKMKNADTAREHNFLWRVAAYGGVIFSICAIGYNHWQTREEFLFWKYKWTDPAQMASIKFDFARAPVAFNEKIAKQMYPGKPIRCMQYFPGEIQYFFGSDECYFWTESFNDLPGKMSEFVFAKDRLTAVRIEFPLWQTDTHHRALVEQYGEPLRNWSAIVASLGATRLSGIGALALIQSNHTSVWMLPAGVLVTDASIAWKEPHGLLFWMAKEWFCENRRAGSDTALSADAYCKG